MLVESERLGLVEIDPDTIVELPAGLAGFEDARRFALIPADEVGAYCWLQSLDEADLAFLAAVPGFFFPDYEPDLPEEDADALGIDRVDQVQLLCLVSIIDDLISANLMGPVVLNVVTRQARQVVLADQGWSTREPLGGA